MADDSDENPRADPPEERPTVEIPAYKRGDEVVAWSTVDAEWWDHVQRSEAVHELVVERYLSEPGVVSIERTAGEENIAGLATNAVSVLVTDRASADALDLPAEIDGISLTVEIGDVVDTD